MGARALDVGVIAAALLGTAGLGWWLFQPRASLDGVDRLLETGKFQAAERQLLDYLADHPDNRPARFMLAQAALARPDPKPAQALDTIASIKPRTRAEAAELKRIEGDAHFAQLFYDKAETAWRAALDLDPLVPEAGWRLLNIHALQGRFDDSRQLGLKLFKLEPDPHDRIQLLLQLIRHDAHALSPDWVVSQLDKVVAANPADLPSTLALGLALVKSSQFDRGTVILEHATAAHPENPAAWEAYLSGLVDAAAIDKLRAALAALPPTMADDPRFDVARGWIASQEQDWNTATTCYERAWQARPSDAPTAYRLQLALKITKQQDKLQQLASRIEATTTARDRLRVLWDTLDALPDLGRKPYPDLYLEVAARLDELNRPEEAAAWRSLIPSPATGPVSPSPTPANLP